MKPHKLKLTLSFFICVIALLLSAEMSFSQAPQGGRRAIVVDERLAALRREPELNGRLVKRLGRGRKVAIRGSRTTREGIVFFRITVTTRTHGWIQREAVVSAGRTGDDRFLLDLIKASQGFERIARARIFLDHFQRSPLRPQVLLLLANTAEEVAAKLSRDAANRLNSAKGAAPEFTYFLNYSGLDRYNRQRVNFTFHQQTKRFHYDGAAWRDLVRRHPNTSEAAEARKHLAQLAAKTQ
jgi:hypothetical protein